MVPTHNTEIINNAVGFFIHQDPSSMLIIQPTEKMGEKWSKKRLATMIRDTPELAAQIADPKSRSSGNTIMAKSFPGGALSIVGANAPSGLASEPMRVVLADEVDRYPVSAGTEGDPLELARARQTTFWNRKTLIGSTPTLKEFSPIEREYEASDRRVLELKCPHCDEFSEPRWSQVRWDKEIVGEESRHLPETAHFQCEHCGVLWSEGDRLTAIDNSRWRATAPFRGIAGFRLNAIASKFVVLSELVTKFLKARERPELLQNFVNLVLGETWEIEGAGVDAEHFLERAEAYGPEDLPDTVIAATAGVDTQDDRLEVQLIAWGDDFEAWPFRYEVIHGDPAQQEVWNELDEIRRAAYRTAGGRTVRVVATCVDSQGHHGDAVFRYCRKRKTQRCFAIQGARGPRPIWPARASQTRRKQTVYTLGVDTAKDAIYGRLKIEWNGEGPRPGYVHFPAQRGFGPDYYAQLTSEKVQTRYKEGRPYRVWVLPKGKRNEGLDTFVYALAAWMSRPRKRRPPPPPPTSKPADQVPVNMQPDPPARPRKLSRRGNWIPRRRGKWL